MLKFLKRLFRREPAPIEVYRAGDLKELIIDASGINFGINPTAMLHVNPSGGVLLEDDISHLSTPEFNPLPALRVGKLEGVVR